MNVIRLIISTLALWFLVITPGNAFAQHESQSDSAKNSRAVTENRKEAVQHCCMKKHNHTGDVINKNNDTLLIRRGEIDLEAIDENKDGKVFQDHMDWNVISDRSGECPLCGMKMEEVSLAEAKQNLLRHNYKIKE